MLGSHLAVTDSYPAVCFIAQIQKRAQYCKSDDTHWRKSTLCFSLRDSSLHSASVPVSPHRKMAPADNKSKPEETDVKKTPSEVKTDPNEAAQTNGDEVKAWSSPTGTRQSQLFKTSHHNIETRLQMVSFFSVFYEFQNKQQLCRSVEWNKILCTCIFPPRVHFYFVLRFVLCFVFKVLFNIQSKKKTKILYLSSILIYWREPKLNLKGTLLGKLCE